METIATFRRDRYLDVSPETPVRYLIIEGQYPHQMMLEVNHYLDRGWEVAGGLTRDDGKFYQALTRRPVTVMSDAYGSEAR